MDIKEIFEDKIKIEPKVMSIDSLFYNPERVKNTDFKPSYQRNYVWDDEKASYFIESILLGTEIPPLVYFRNSDKIEIIDGRQRYQTILRYKNNELKLKKSGLQKLGNTGIANKLYKDIDSHLQDLFRDTKIRIIEFSFHSRKGINDDVEELVKKEIFKRYNSGITPLKPTEIDNAVYFEDDLNSFLKRKLKDDEVIYRNISSVLHFEKNDIEVILKKIRQLLVQHEIPIKYYSVKKHTIISKFYEGLFAKIDSSQTEEIYTSFIRKINLLLKIKEEFIKNAHYSYNRLISETLFWAFSILENEEIEYPTYSNKEFISKIISYLYDNIEAFTIQRSSFAKELYYRYDVIAKFFEDEFNLNLNIYLDYSLDFKQRNKNITPENEERVSFDDLRINKPEPSSIAIMDVCRQMERQKFLIRPPYQRNEVINQKKSSSIIESIILGIKLPPIFVFKRQDGISEVLDGQQRLLSILAYIQKPYLDENHNIRHSNKNGFSLNLKNNGILKDLHGDKFEDLSPENQEKIKNFDLWIIEIDYKNNKNFEPIDLFVRLNNKPYPIKDDTFEMWNSYISRDIIDTIKSVHSNHFNWFYFRKNNSRMEDENIYTALAYFQFCCSREKNEDRQNSYYPEEIDIYKVGSKINFRVKSKVEITRVLENPETKDDFIKAVNHLEFDFIRKLKNLLSDDSTPSNVVLSKSLDDIFMIGNARRTQQGFYALWYFLFDIPTESINKNKKEIRNSLKKLFLYMTNIEDKSTFEQYVFDFKNQYLSIRKKKRYEIAFLKEISMLNMGIMKKNNPEYRPYVQGNLFDEFTENDNIIKYRYIFIKDFSNLKIKKEDLDFIEIGQGSLREVFDSKSKILLSRVINYDNRLKVVYTEQKIAFGNNIIGIVINRPIILPKYVATLLSSRFYYYRYFLTKAKETTISNVSLSDIGNLEIPVLSIDQQRIFELIFDYVSNSEPQSKIALFFERIMDAMVYEIFFEEQFRDSDIKISEFASLLVELDNFDETKKARIIKDLYDVYSSPEHQLGANLIKLMNISFVREIETISN